MFVILTYDVRQKRHSKTRKICKKYLYDKPRRGFSVCVQGAVLPQRHKRRIGFQHGK